jgi:hypothetical protein
VRSLCDPPTSANELPAPLADGLAVDAVDPVLDEVLEAVEPVVEGDVAPAAEPVGAPVLPGEAAEGLVVEPVAPAVEPAIGAVEEPMLPAALLPTLAPVSMKPPPALAELPVVPVAPVVPAADAVLPAPDPDTRQPVTTTVLLSLLLMLPACPGVALVVCAAAPAPSATAIIVPKRNCRFITSSVLG